MVTRNHGNTTMISALQTHTCQIICVSPLFISFDMIDSRTFLTLQLQAWLEILNSDGHAIVHAQMSVSGFI